MNRAIFVDRDGVLTKLVHRDGILSTAQNKDELEWFPGIRDSVAKAHSCGFKLFVTSNQPTEDWLNKEETQDDWLAYTASLLIHTFQFDGYMFATDRGSRFYKPNPGMIKDLAEAYELDLPWCWSIGDRWKDAIAARLADVKYIHIHGEDPLTSYWNIVDNFNSAIDYIVRVDKFEKKLFEEAMNGE